MKTRFYNLNSLGDLSSAVLRNEIFFTRNVKPIFLIDKKANFRVKFADHLEFELALGK